MIRLLNPAPAVYDIGQIRALAAARFPTLLDCNEVNDGTQQIAVYLPSTPTQAKQTAWASDLAAYVLSHPTSTDVAGNEATLEQRIDSGIATLKQWVANNPNGAVLTAGQTLTLAKMLIGLAKVVRGQLDDTTGT